MSKLIWIGVVVCALASAATTSTTTSDATKKKAAAKRPAHSTAGHSTTAHPQTTASATAAKAPATKAPAKAASKTAATKPSTTARAKTKARPRVVRSYQQAPTPDRYKEIQQALIDKGYLHGEPTGEWGPDSVDALTRFQRDQNLTADGKIGALSLIALGLGPKRLTAQTGPQQPASDPAK